MNKNLDLFILTRRELQIMKVVWENEAVTVKEVHAALTKIKPISRNTILTLIRILDHKGALAHRRSGRAYVYEPLLSRRQATQNQIRNLIVRFFDGVPEKLIENLIQNEVKTPEQLGSAKALVALKSLPVFAIEVTAPESSGVTAAVNQ